MGKTNSPHFKIAFTFSGVYRESLIRPTCEALLEYGFKKDEIFFDDWHPEIINGVNGADKLQAIYHDYSDCIVVLLSPDYHEKNWTGSVEWDAIKDLIRTKNGDKICLLSVNDFDISKVSGIYGGSAIYRPVDTITPKEIAIFIKKIYNNFLDTVENIDNLAGAEDRIADNYEFDYGSNIQTILSRALTYICETTQTDYNQIVLSYTTTPYNVKLYVVADNVANNKQRYRVVHLQGAMGKAFFSGKEIIIDNTEEYSSYSPAVMATASEAVIPIIFQGEIIGVINSEAEDKGYYSDKIKNKLRIISSTLADALINAGYKKDTSADDIPYVHISMYGRYGSRHFLEF